MEMFSAFLAFCEEGSPLQWAGKMQSSVLFCCQPEQTNVQQ